MNYIENTLHHNGYIEIVGNNVMYIDNHKRIAEFTDEVIKVVCHSKIITVKGCNLKIDYYSCDEMKLSGVINEIKFS
ncbi:MAG: hypothetical protein E7254_03245 [Lachnospiraceae bacterium]|nr:hypothetical protein [Lachnospiraceae bacterium]